MIRNTINKLLFINVFVRLGVPAKVGYAPITWYRFIWLQALHDTNPTKAAKICNKKAPYLIPYILRDISLPARFFFENARKPRPREFNPNLEYTYMVPTNTIADATSHRVHRFHIILRSNRSAVCSLPCQASKELELVQGLSTIVLAETIGPQELNSSVEIKFHFCFDHTWYPFHFRCHTPSMSVLILMMQ